MALAPKKATDLAPSGKPWSYGVRTCQADGTSRNNFKWPLEIGARAEAPDWSSVKKCGFGLHANKFGMEDWSLLSGDFADVLMIVRWDSAEEVDLEGKHKFPWAEVVEVQPYKNWGVIEQKLASLRNIHIQTLIHEAIQTKDEKTAFAAGDYGHASAAGNSGHASAAGDYGHASAAGYRGHASAAGDYGIAAAFGIEGKAKAAVSGAIVLAYWHRQPDYSYVLKHVFAGMVGQTYGEVTLEPDTFYTLTADGLPVPAT